MMTLGNMRANGALARGVVHACGRAERRTVAGSHPGAELDG
jgi:hypothetical protein